MFGMQDDMVLGNIRIHRAKREPCIICGHPTGDCVGTTNPPARIVGANMARSQDAPGVLATEDIYEEVQITPYTKTRVLVARAGQIVPRQRAERLGLI